MYCKCCNKEIGENQNIDGVCLECDNEIKKRILQKNNDKEKKINELVKYEINRKKELNQNTINYSSNDDDSISWSTIIVIFILAVITIVSMIFYFWDESDSSKYTTSTNKKYTISTNTSTNISKQSTTKKTIFFGEEGTIGNWKIKVLDVKNSQTIGNKYFSTSTNNNYVIVTCAITNVSTEPQTLATTKISSTDTTYRAYVDTEFQLYDGKSSYNFDESLGHYIDNNFHWLNEINPNTTVTYTLVFETDESSTEKDYILRLESNKNIEFNLE